MFHWEKEFLSLSHSFLEFMDSFFHLYSFFFFYSSMACLALWVGNSSLAPMISSWTTCHLSSLGTPRAPEFHVSFQEWKHCVRVFFLFGSFCLDVLLATLRGGVMQWTIAGIQKLGIIRTRSESGSSTSQLCVILGTWLKFSQSSSFSCFHSTHDGDTMKPIFTHEKTEVQKVS